MISPEFEKLSAEFPTIVFLKVDVDEVEVRLWPCLRAIFTNLGSLLLLPLPPRCHRGPSDHPGKKTLIPGPPSNLRSVSLIYAGCRQRVRHQRHAHLPGVEGRGEGIGACGRLQGEAQGALRKVRMNASVRKQHPKCCWTRRAPLLCGIWRSLPGMVAAAVVTGRRCSLWSGTARRAQRTPSPLCNVNWR